MRFAAVVCAVLIIVGAVASSAILLNRIDRLREELRDSKKQADSARSLAIMASTKSDVVRSRIEHIESTLRVCKMRSEWLRNVVETFVPLGDRVRIPDPPPGWDRWPTPQPE